MKRTQPQVNVDARPAEIDDARYRLWLQKQVKLTERSLGDLVSRTKRVRGMVDLSTLKTDDHVDAALLMNSLFKAQTMSVKSQLRRAAKLYVQFRQNQNA